jgi:hypothetical protein
MLFLSPGRSCFSTSNHMLIRSVSMFYSVLAAADDRRRPWADPATQTHQTLSLLLHSLTRHTKSLWWRSNKWCTGAIERNPREVPKWRQFSFDQEFCQFQKKILSTNVKQFFGWMKKWCVCCCNGASFSNGVSERHWTRPLSVKDWLTLTQQTPVSRTLPPVR